MLDPGRELTTSVGPEDWSRGPRDAPNVLVEYADFECARSASLEPLLRKLLELSRGRLRVIFRHYPSTLAHPHALAAAEAAEAAGAQGRFWEMHDLLFAHRDELEYQSLIRYAEKLELDVERFSTALSTHEHLRDVEVDFRRGVRDAVTDTPALFINGRIYSGSHELSSLLSALA